MRPTFDVNLKEINIDSYRITPSEDEIEKTIKSIQDNNKIEEQPAELNEELFEKIFPGKEIKTLEAFKAKVAEEMKIQYIVEENRMFLNRAIDLLVENVKFDMPDTFIRRWIVENSEGKITPEDVEKNYESIYSKSFRWQLIEEALLKIEPGLIIKEEETRAYATRAFFPHIDPATIDDEMKKQLLHHQTLYKKIYQLFHDPFL